VLICVAVEALLLTLLSVPLFEVGQDPNAFNITGLMSCLANCRKNKVILVNAMRAYRGSRGIATLVFKPRGSLDVRGQLQAPAT